MAAPYPNKYGCRSKVVRGRVVGLRVVVVVVVVLAKIVVAVLRRVGASGALSKMGLLLLTSDDVAATVGGVEELSLMVRIKKSKGNRLQCLER
jgi:hypothetical protein